MTVTKLPIKLDDFSGYRRQTRDYVDGLLEAWEFEETQEFMLLHQLARCLDVIQEAQDLLEAEGLIIGQGTGSAKQHPAWTIERDARNQLYQTLKKLDLNEEVAPKMGRPARGATG